MRIGDMTFSLTEPCYNGPRWLGFDGAEDEGFDLDGGVEGEFGGGGAFAGDFSKGVGDVLDELGGLL